MDETPTATQADPPTHPDDAVAANRRRGRGPALRRPPTGAAGDALGRTGPGRRGQVATDAMSGDALGGSGPRRRGRVTTDAMSGDALARTERHLRVLSRGQERATLRRWRASCHLLADAPVTAPAQVTVWLRHLPTAQADIVLGQLVRHAQRGDAVALLVVLLCLEPGLRGLCARTGITTDEAVSEVALGILSYPVDRRSSVAGGLLLDARNRVYRAARRDGRTDPLDEHVAHPPATGELGAATPPAQRIVQLVCQAHRQGLLDRTEARLILDTRLGGHKVKPVADVLGLTPSAAYQRRSRAEARLVQVA